MREILFRAKEISTDKWVEGYLVKISENDYRIATEEDISWSYTKLGDYDGIMTRVAPETICQYTGLTDKNGNKIWENDVVKNVTECVVYKCSYNLYNCEYQFNNKNESFGMGYASIHKFEVIGNIFDNPELLEDE